MNSYRNPFQIRLLGACLFLAAFGGGVFFAAADYVTLPASEAPHSQPCLRLLLHSTTGSANFGEVKGLHGAMYFAGAWPAPAIASTNRVDILSSKDNRRIVVMVAENGPIYSSTNSGMTWITVSGPGEYHFMLTSDERGNGLMAAGTIHPSPQNQTDSNSPLTNWYAIGSAADGSRLVLMENAVQAAPALKITRSSSGTIVSWPSGFASFVLQENNDLSSTNWTDVSIPVKTVGDENQVDVSTPLGSTFYRLRSK